MTEQTTPEETQETTPPEETQGTTTPEEPPSETVPVDEAAQAAFEEGSGPSRLKTEIASLTRMKAEAEVQENAGYAEGLGESLEVVEGMNVSRSNKPVEYVGGHRSALATSYLSAEAQGNVAKANGLSEGVASLGRIQDAYEADRLGSEG